MVASYDQGLTMTPFNELLSCVPQTHLMKELRGYFPATVL
jgi:hypothetical protein